MQICPEQPTDVAAIHALNTAAFERVAEADLVDALRQQASPLVSLVAIQGEQVVGHILFTPVTLSSHPNLKIMGLAPIAVSPAHQKQGIGAALIQAGLQECRKIGYGAIVVLGHPDYYPKFGFVPTSQYQITCEYDVPPEAFMLVELIAGYLENKSGMISFHPAFKSV